MKNQEKRYFILSTTTTLFILSLLSGFLIVEKNVREVILENSAPFFEFKQKNSMPELLKIHFMGRDFIFNFK